MTRGNESMRGKWRTSQKGNDGRAGNGHDGRARSGTEARRAVVERGRVRHGRFQRVRHCLSGESVIFHSMDELPSVIRNPSNFPMLQHTNQLCKKILCLKCSTSFKTARRASNLPEGLKSGRRLQKTKGFKNCPKGKSDFNYVLRTKKVASLYRKAKLLVHNP